MKQQDVFMYQKFLENMSQQILMIHQLLYYIFICPVQGMQGTSNSLILGRRMNEGMRGRHYLFWGAMLSLGIFWILLKSFKFFLILLKFFGLLLKLFESFRIPWNCLVSFGIFWVTLESFGIFRDLLDYFRIFWILGDY